MNGYSLSRQYFDWAFENPTENNPTMTALYFFIVEINNRLGWKKQFTITPRECLEGIGVSSYNTYKKNFDKLIEIGFINVIKPSKNQYQANIIALSKINNAHSNALNNTLNNADTNTLDNADNKANNALSKNSKALNKADEKQVPKQVHSMIQPSCDIHKTTNNKQQTIESIEKPKRFSAPTLNDVIDFYIDPSGMNLNPTESEYWANRFVDFYTSNGWKVGKNQMKDWKAAARKCAREWDDKRKNQAAKPTEVLKKADYKDEEIKAAVKRALEIRTQKQESVRDRLKAENPNALWTELIGAWDSTWKSEYYAQCKAEGIDPNIYTI